MNRSLLTVAALLAVAATAWSAPPPKTPKAAPAMAPTVSVAGVRVVGVGYGEDGREAQAFNESSGVGLALVVQTTGAGGIIAFDNDTSSLDELADSTGKNLLDEASIWPFPKLTKDGKAVIVEMKARGVPAAGATEVHAKGKLSLTTATGSKPVKVPNVALANDKTFKLGTGTITLSEVEASDGKTSVTFKGPLAVFAAIRGMKFLDAKGQPIESSSAGSGRMNDVAMASYRLTTAAKAVTLEIDQWQGMKPVVVPFDVKAGLGLSQ
jgi:hypothetical protein